MTTINWCETHNSKRMLKDACERVMANMDRGGATNIGEQMNGRQPCVFIKQRLVAADVTLYERVVTIEKCQPYGCRPPHHEVVKYVEVSDDD